MAEKTVDDLPRDLRILFTRGSDALSRDNFDYAIDLFNQVLAREPGLHECRRSLRAAQIRKAGSGGGFFKKVFSNASASPMIVKGQVTLREDPAKAMQIAEQVLNSDPSNSAAHRLIVEAATALELPHTAVLSLEILHHNAPKDKDTAIRLANALAETGEVQRGETILSDLCRQFPIDNDLAQALKNVSARKTMDEGGYEELADGSGSYRDILKNKEEAVALEQANRQVQAEDVADRLIREYEGRLKNEPDNLRLLRSLAELYTQKKQYEKALTCYERLRGTEAANDPTLERAITDTMVRKLDEQTAQLDATATDYAEQVALLQGEKQALQLSQAQKRVERFPTDLTLRFELGQCYFQAGKIGEAIQELQKAQNNPNKRIAAMSLLAQCFAKRRMNDLAARTLQTALKEKQVFDEEKKELIYQLGSVLEAMGKKEDAIEQFKVIYEVDIGYKDVAARVDAYYQGLG